MFIRCPSCGETEHVPSSAVGKMGQCNACRRIFQISDSDDLIGLAGEEAIAEATRSRDEAIAEISRNDWLLASEALARAEAARNEGARKQRNTLKLKPKPTLIRNFRDAECVARDWMRYLGFDDAELTPNGPDGGVDVVASRALAQVKAEMKPTGRPLIQALYGIAAHKGVQALFFSLDRFSDEAKAWAQEAGVALFRFDLAGEVEPVNARAKEIFEASGA